MPIKFRCAYCNQLLGIARRKAGTVVRCPTCAGQVVVPSSDDAGTEKPDGPAPPPLFERSDFQKLFEPAPEEDPAIEASPSPPPVPAGAPPEINVEPVANAVSVAAPPKPGIVLSPAKATLLSVLAVILLAVAFGGGLLLGLMLSSSS
jgi:phage FluMu protein Com